MSLDTEKQPLLARDKLQAEGKHVALLRFRAWAFLGVIVTVIACVMYVFVSGAAYTDAEEFGTWVKRYDFYVVTLVVFLVILTCEAIGVPSTLLCTTAAYIYATKLGETAGFFAAIVVSYLGSASGALIALFLGRTVLKEWSEELIADNRVMMAVQRAVVKNQWKVNLLLRLSPVPDAITNYGLSCSDTSMAAFVAGTVGLIPWIVLDCYVGSTLSSLSSLSHTSTLQYIEYAVMVVMLVAFVWLLTVWAKRALMDVVNESEAANRKATTAAPVPDGRPSDGILEI